MPRMCSTRTLKDSPCGHPAVYRMDTSTPVCGIHRRLRLGAEARAPQAVRECCDGLSPSRDRE